MQFFRAINPMAKDTGYFCEQLGKSDLIIVDLTVAENIASTYIPSRNYLTHMEQIYSILVGSHYPISPIFIDPIFAKGILDFLIFPLISRALISGIDDEKHPILALAGYAVALPLEIARFTLGIGLTLLLAPVVALIDFLQYCFPIKPEENQVGPRL